MSDNAQQLHHWSFSVEADFPGIAVLMREAARELKLLRDANRKLLDEREAAAGECLVEIPPIGSDAGKLMLANRMMMYEIDRLKAEVARLRKLSCCWCGNGDGMVDGEEWLHDTRYGQLYCEAKP